MNVVGVIYSVLFAALMSVVRSKESLARGFNDDIDWTTMEDGLKAAESSNKPLMVLIHKTWCGACKQLKPQFATSNDIVKQSENFIMVNIQDAEEEALDMSFRDLGQYIPRIIFVEPNGKVRADIKNSEGNSQYPYYYSNPTQVLSAMRNALNVIEGGSPTRGNGEL